MLDTFSKFYGVIFMLLWAIGLLNILDISLPDPLNDFNDIIVAIFSSPFSFLLLSMLMWTMGMHVLARQNNWYKLKQKYSKHKDSEEPVRLKRVNSVISGSPNNVTKIAFSKDGLIVGMVLFF
jgi:hypothetical protein